MDEGQPDPDNGPPPPRRLQNWPRHRGGGNRHREQQNNNYNRVNPQNQSILQRMRGEQRPYRSVNRHMPHGYARPEEEELYQQMPYRRGENMNRGQWNRGNRDNSRGMGFKILEEIANSDPIDIIAKINERKESFFSLFSKPAEADIYVLTIKILAKVSLSSFAELKLRIMLDICNSQFMMYLRDYLINLPYDDERTRKRNRFYWNNPDDFWKNLITFCHCIFNMMPSVALQKLRSLIDGTAKTCLDELNSRHNFVLSEFNTFKLRELRENLSTMEMKKEDENKDTKARQRDEQEEEPPEDFRQLSVIPTREELLEKRAYVRANVVRGGYRDIDHYLDVQFRLLREDCFGPLREGLLQYRSDPNKKKYDNIRVYRNVKFIGPYISTTKAGLMIQLDETTVKRLKRINWAYSKRFIFGSLLLFTRDNCASFVVATILDRDTNCLSQGKIPITVVENGNSINTDNINKTQDPYVMIESEVYFEPYFHVLKALQDPNFAPHVAMSKYVVKVDPIPQPPKYLLPETIFEVETQYALESKFRVLQANTWPTKEDLNLNESQFEAYKLALTHEFAVIQGPPGTGKTYLGVKVAETLLKNLQTDRKFCLMLVICYTNHALDQFLEHILGVTDSIVRIGGQSRNEAMEKISLNNLRRGKKHCEANNLFINLFMSEKRNLKEIMTKLLVAQKQIDSLSNGILTYGSMRKYVQEVNILMNYYQRRTEDILMTWLFENVQYDQEVNHIMDQIFEENYELTENPIDQDDAHERTDTILDDLLKEIEINGIEISTSFMLNDAEKKLQELKRRYVKKDINRDEKQSMVTNMCGIFKMKAVFLEMRERYRVRGVPREIRAGENLSQLSNLDRWSIYFTWANAAINKIRELTAPLQEKMNSASVAYEEARMNLDLALLRGIRVVGMTTSGAARLRKLLAALAPPIVIVEEAAEVLEQHIITSLTNHCEHLILIGDHQQLRPSAAYMKLARHYDIEVSLFERMILNNMHSRRLSVQHRMRPEIAALISPHIYSDLTNHPSVEAFPRVRGVTNNMFFFSHDFKEEVVEDSASRSNQKEANIVLGVANYLMQQGYDPTDVTILAAYSGQMFYMRKQRGNYAFLTKVKITVVDNYQGEESKIILLSLVRNNDENRIGFLGTENRICVALSRAKEGFYIFGNIDILKANSPLWTKIATTLENGGSLGSTLRLRCQNHPDEISTISTEKDFEKVPEGGCRLMCNVKLPACGHPCPLICHGYDRGHAEIKCPLNCERVICDLGHVCPQKCAAKCAPCKQPVKKSLPCGHDMFVPCHREPTDPAVKCQTTVTVVLPDCGHEAKKPCHLDVKRVQCAVQCVSRVEKCGHQCRRRCHVTDDPEHEKYICQKPCAKAKKGCTANLVGDLGDHQCLKMCYEACDNCTVEVVKKRSTCKHTERVACCKDVDEDACKKKCARVLQDCGHFCKKKCYEKCGDCDQKVTKVIPECGHSIKVQCKVEVTRKMCTEPCQRILPCGHECRGRCADECTISKCTAIIDKTFTSVCGHKVKLPCNVWNIHVKDGEVKSKLLLAYCTAPCTQELACGHACAGACGRCRQGRAHAPCAQRCHVDIICGHQCEEPCNQVCPPCKKRCEVKCPHTRCSKICGAPCVPCQEKCTRRCRHGACKHKCGDPCSRPPCNEPCPLTQACGHPCRGLCGEPCPNICRVCRPDEFPKDFLGDDFDDDAKFITLQDCNHVMELEDADNLMQGNNESITIRACPFCRKPIINTYRYKDRVNEMYRTEINPIKEQVYGTQEQVKTKQNELIAVITAFKNTHSLNILGHTHFKKALNSLEIVIKKQNKISLLQLKMHFLYIEIMHMVGKKIMEYDVVNMKQTYILREEFYEPIQIICEMLIANIQKISQQQQRDISNEIKRSGSIIQFCKIANHQAYLMAKNVSAVEAATSNAKEAVLTWRVFDENVAMDALKKLQDAVKVCVVTKEERDLVVKAIGLKQGHWYKCPNGHFYCIGECGGAMQVSKCIECGVEIGGQSHRLLPTNRHAPEMDGSSFAAWSETANNMANFNLED